LVTLGKCCVVSEFYAKKFIDQLRNSEFSSLWNNVVLMRYLPDPHLCGRSTRLLTFSSIDGSRGFGAKTHFIHLDPTSARGFHQVQRVADFRVVSRVADHDTEIAQLAFSCIRDVLPMKNPGTFANLLLDAIFFLSACVDHKAFNQLPSKIVDRSFALLGASNGDQRMNVYEKVSSLLSDEQKIATCARINQEIFSAVVDGTLPISKSTEGVIGDCLVLLTTKSLKVHHLKAAPEDHDLEDLEDNQKATQAAKVGCSVRNAQAQFIAKHSSHHSIVEGNFGEGTISVCSQCDGLPQSFASGIWPGEESFIRNWCPNSERNSI
jgi:hypothetical protein